MDVRETEIRARLNDITGPEPHEAERALITRLIASYLAKTPPGVDRLGELLRGGDPGAVREHAHSLKGSSSNLGADHLAGIFADVEQTARTGVLPDPDVTLGRLGAEQALTLTVLERVAADYSA